MLRLSALYCGRAVVISLYHHAADGIFRFALRRHDRILWIATVPLTSGTAAQIFGSRYLSTHYGIVFFSHQIGSFLGVWLAGRLYDSSGSYESVWWLAVDLGLAAALIHLPIADRAIQPHRLERA